MRVHLFLFFLVILLAGCQIPLSGPAKASGNGLKLSFLIAGAGSTSSASRSAAQPRLLLPTVSTLTVALASLTNPQAAATSLTTPINSSPVTVDFGQVNFGNYSVQAQVSDSSGKVQFQQTGTLNFTATTGTNTITLNLVPANLTALASGQIVPPPPAVTTPFATISAGTALSWSVPSNALISGGWSLLLVKDPAVILYAQDSDGALFPSSDTSSTLTGVVLTAPLAASLTTVLVKNSATSFITLYNPGPADRQYRLVLNPPATVSSITFTIPTTPTGTITFSSSPVSVPMGSSITLSPAATNTTSLSGWQWYLNGMLDTTQTSSSYSFTGPTTTTTGVYVISVSVQDQNGVLYSGSVTITAY